MFLPFAHVDKAHAIAAFTRLYKAECTTCHTIYPELNEYGEAFRKNGFVYSDKKGAKKVETPAAPAKTGEDTTPAKDAAKGGGSPLNEAIILSGIPEQLPISFTASLDMVFNQNAPDGNTWDLNSRSLVLQGGGSFKDKAGFYATYNAYTQGRYDPLASNTAANTSPNINELFAIWRHAFNTPVNFRVGRLRPQLSLWKSTNKITVTTPAPLSYRVGRSTFTVDSPTDALEINSLIGKRLFLAAGIVDRNGDDRKEGYGHISFKIGGADFTGEEPDIDLENDSIWDFLSFAIAFYGYSGSNASLASGVADKTNHFYRFGGDMDMFYKALRFKLSGVMGRDTNPGYLAIGSETDSYALAAEAEYQFDTNLMATFRYEYQSDDLGITRRYIPAVAYAPLQNTKVVLEYKYEGAATGDINRMTQLALLFSF
jgi:hypothetical protein